MSYILHQPDIVLRLLIQHLQMTGLTLVLAVVLALPVSLLIRRYRWLHLPTMALLGAIYTIPSLALMILLVPVFGLNAISVVVAMVLYAQVILVRSILVGLQTIPATVLEVALAMGMSRWQRWWQVQVPLMLPVFLAGVRLAAIVTVALATIGAKFGAGGLGVLLFEGIAQAGRYDKIWAGALVVAGLAIVINILLIRLERATDPSRFKSQSSR